VLTIIGDDRPGIVEQLSQQIVATGANWEESRMARTSMPTGPTSWPQRCARWMPAA
jgi:hypothetical protein